MKNVAIIGTVGVPACYGGFETLVENIIGENCSKDINYTIFCSSKEYKEKKKYYKGARLKYLPISANGIQSILYDGICLLESHGYDTVLALGVSGGVFYPLFRLISKNRLIVNIDGLEHKREKWGKSARKFLLFSEKMAMKYADAIVADNKGIKEYIIQTYNSDAKLIAYGGDHVRTDISQEMVDDTLLHYGIKDNEYSLAICRVEPENNCHLILDAFDRKHKDLLFLGNWERSNYGQELKERYKNNGCIHIFPVEYNLKILYALRTHCRYYIHGHSAGGTNPSLVEAMFCNCPILAFDVIYNRETTENRACYFKDVQSLMQLIDNSQIDYERNKRDMEEIAERRYCWSAIAKEYESLY